MFFLGQAQILRIPGKLVWHAGPIGWGYVAYGWGLAVSSSDSGART